MYVNSKLVIEICISRTLVTRQSDLKYSLVLLYSYTTVKQLKSDSSDKPSDWYKPMAGPFRNYDSDSFETCVLKLLSSKNMVYDELSVH